MADRLLIQLSWLDTTPFGWPVLPDVSGPMQGASPPCAGGDQVSSAGCESLDEGARTGRSPGIAAQCSCRGDGASPRAMQAAPIMAAAERRASMVVRASR